jgi:hypothetical protein
MLAGTVGREPIGRLMSPEVLPAAKALADRALTLITRVASRRRRHMAGDREQEIDMTGSPREWAAERNVLRYTGRMRGAPCQDATIPWL